MNYRCFIAALLLHIVIGACFFVPDNNIDMPTVTYIHAYLVKNNSDLSNKDLDTAVKPRYDDGEPDYRLPPSPSSRDLLVRRNPDESETVIFAPTPSSRDLIAGSSIFKNSLDPLFRKDDNKQHKNENQNNSTNNSQTTKLAIYLHDQIQQNLADANLPDSIQNQKIQIEFTLTNTGIIKDIKLQQSTGFKLIDQEIIDAVANISTIPSKLLLQQTQQFSLIVLTANNTM